MPIALIVVLLCGQTALAQVRTLPPQAKIARDLAAALADTGKAKASWMRDLNGNRHVQAIVVSNSSDPAMTELRAAVLRSGGTVHAVHGAVRALTVQIRANDVLALAQRNDVASVSPNRVTRRTASTLESITGTLTGNVRNGSIKTNGSGLDGSGIGIAVLDSGVMKAHQAFADGSGGSRVQAQRRLAQRSCRELGQHERRDRVRSRQPGARRVRGGDRQRRPPTQDRYGHGTHVAAIAAGCARTYGSSTPDATGIAPNATSTTSRCSTTTAAAR